MIRIYLSEEIKRKIRTNHHRDGSGFAKENKCVGIVGYSDLEYFTKIAKEVAKSAKQEIIVRYQYYVPS